MGAVFQTQVKVVPISCLGMVILDTYLPDVFAIMSELNEKKIRKQIMQGLIIKQATDWMI